VGNVFGGSWSAIGGGSRYDLCIDSVL